MSDTKKLTNEDLVEIDNMMKATGLSREEVAELLMIDKELDDLCDATLSSLSWPHTKITTPER